MASSYKRYARDGWGTQLSKKGAAGKQRPMKNTQRKSEFTSPPKPTQTALRIAEAFNTPLGQIFESVCTPRGRR